MQFRVLLYYKFARIEDHEQFADTHRELCRSLHLRGRIIIAPEGINGTVSGKLENTEAYIQIIREDPRFADMDFKIDEHDGHAFRKLFVRARDEIISLGNGFTDVSSTGEYISAKQFKEKLLSNDAIIVDGRNSFEHEIGHFRGAMLPDVEHFRDLPKWIDRHLSDSKDKLVITYCTGGIRCEKLTAYLLSKGFRNVHQLKGGIVSYGKDPDVKGELFDGKCYVFDERISVDVNTTESNTIISKCKHCEATTERYINCANVDCNIQFFCCEDCGGEHESCCSDKCFHAPRHRKPGERYTATARSI